MFTKKQFLTNGTMAMLLDNGIAKGWDYKRIAVVAQYVSNFRGFSLKYTAGTVSAHKRYRDALHLQRKARATVVAKIS